MKTCRVCGALVDDREWNCPECGATMITSGGGLSLKADEPVKKKTGNRMGTTVSTGSGLTDILRREDDEYDDVDDTPVIMGSLPGNMSRGIEEDEKARKKAKNDIRIMTNIFKVIFAAAVIFIVYLFVTKFIMKDKGADSYEALVDIYVEAVNEGDVALMKTIMPEFISDRADEAQTLVDDMDGVEFTSYTIKNKEEIDRAQLDIFTDEIKLSTGNNPNLNEGYYLEVEFVGKNKDGLEIKATAVMEVYRVKHLWYLYPYTYENRAFSD